MKPANIGLKFSSKTSFDQFKMNLDIIAFEHEFVIKIFDFGLAEATDGESLMLTSKSGTPLYSSPEQLDGKV
jgi:serine/threonine protein kinase